MVTNRSATSWSIAIELHIRLAPVPVDGREEGAAGRPCEVAALQFLAAPFLVGRKRKHVKAWKFCSTSLHSARPVPGTEEPG